ncbi:calcium/sodium antiporter [Candidatus Dojkabacteria bacterium]|nr:calcium/sodium antiporter [Candidatus Dojkabacteria bacterium]
MIVLTWIIILIISLLVLTRASDWLSDSAEKIGLALGIPSFIVGVTIVSLGTSLPEIISSIFAVVEGSSEIVTANVFGSNITNIFLILGLSAITARKLEISYDLLHVDLPLFVGSAFYLGLALLDAEFTLFEGIIGIAGSLIYLFYTISIRRNKESESIKEELLDEHKSYHLDTKILLKIIVSSALIFVSAKYTVESVIELSKILEVGVEIVAILAVSFGTSLPELSVALNAARKGKSEIVVGSILGSSIFNSFAVLGISSMFGTIVIPSTLLTFGLPVMLAATILYFFITQEKQITQWEGAMLLLFYAIFVQEVIRAAV